MHVDVFDDDYLARDVYDVYRDSSFVQLRASIMYQIYLHPMDVRQVNDVLKSADSSTRKMMNDYYVNDEVVVVVGK